MTRFAPRTGRVFCEGHQRPAQVLPSIDSRRAEAHAGHTRVESNAGGRGVTAGETAFHTENKHCRAEQGRNPLLVAGLMDPQTEPKTAHHPQRRLDCVTGSDRIEALCGTVDKLVKSPDFQSGHRGFEPRRSLQHSSAHEGLQRGAGARDLEARCEGLSWAGECWYAPNR